MPFDLEARYLFFVMTGNVRMIEKMVRSGFVIRESLRFVEDLTAQGQAYFERLVAKNEKATA